ncbi:vitamin K epoxide reductase family protein [Actinomycetospora lemnae]|uniref:Vitamin K epoxide reductase family protein n=1 Tax=Actinomycetospora lemnae TaxID=3019891 RepID=A0ABT5SY49_9PSEU|nr:vitamin K epoxide reductase family protein [Actinomycetospora sp. DW7H6]MDD7967778.1 vitamin K epoxide reductase family protein [Actinomycetospora sp. DW7H6]
MIVAPEDAATPPTASVSSSRGTGSVLLVAGLIGAAAALVLLVEKIALLAKPDYLPSCSIDAVLSCGSIMRTAQSEVLGFPNPIIGLATFPVVAAVGALLLARTPLPAWCWLALQGGVAAAVAFVGWLIIQSVAVIGALCPYCMVVWAATIAVFWFVTAENLERGHLVAGPPGRLVARHPGAATVVSYVVVLAVVVASFPTWFAGLIGL